MPRLDVGALRDALDGNTDRLMTEYADDPVRYAVEVLGVSPWDLQADFLRACAANPRVALKAGHKVSKSNSLAILSLWFVSTKPGARVIFTNSSSRQVRVVNWYEFRKLYRNSKIPIGGTLFDVPDRGLEFSDGRQVLGFTTDQPDNWGGVSGQNLLFICDEASGIPEIIFDAINGNCAGDNAWVVLTGNPLRPSGYFYDCFTSRAAGWKLITISSLDSPNYREGREVIRGLASRKWRQQMEDDYGIDSPLYSARVLGEFALQSEYAVISLGDVLAAVERGLTAPKLSACTEPLVIGVDVARFGDDESVIICRRGFVVSDPIVFRNLDGPKLADKIAEVALKNKRDEKERPTVNVDIIGVGASPFDALKNNHPWINAVAVNVAESPTKDDHFDKLRDQLWFGIGAWLKAGGCLPSDRKLQGELVAPLYSFTAKGDRKVEPKADLKKRLKRSPDRADALALAIHDGNHGRATFGDLPFKSPQWAFGGGSPFGDNAADPDEGWSQRY